MNYLLVLFSLLFVFDASATDQIMSNATTLFTGPITNDSVNEFIKRNSSNAELTEVEIASQGGDGMAALRFANWIKDKGLDVRVRNACFSACANYIFLAGKNKIINKGSFVGWHGDADQKDLRELVSKCDAIEERKLRNLPVSAAGEKFLDDKNKECASVRQVHLEQVKFYKMVGVDPIVGRLGQEPINYPSDGWTLTVKAMNYFGIRNVTAPENYAQVNYFRRYPLANFMNKGPILIFDIDDTGKLIPLNLSQPVTESSYGH